MLLLHLLHDSFLCLHLKGYFLGPLVMAACCCLLLSASQLRDGHGGDSPCHSPASVSLLSLCLCGGLSQSLCFCFMWQLSSALAGLEGDRVLCPPSAPGILVTQAQDGFLSILWGTGSFAFTLFLESVVVICALGGLWPSVQSFIRGQKGMRVLEFSTAVVASWVYTNERGFL